ncbi:MAG: class I SAM-dependent methyltransferase [Clostridia bacterium]|nr:class I SAM-dependent methyltransferase [Clostridia bacterium]
MADHYYTQQPASEHRERAVQATACGLTLRFVTDAGVFSKDELDPGSRLLIESMPPLSGRVLDLGCGWGPVGAFLAKLNPQAQLVLADVNERALALAKRNMQGNGLRGEVLQSDGFQAIEGMFSHVVTNPPIRAGKQLIYALFDEAYSRLLPGGTLTIVIRKQQGAPSALKHFQETFGGAEIIAKDAGYWIIRARKEA